MPQPFSVHDQADPGTDLGRWDKDGNITIPGTLTAANVVNTGGGGGGGGGVNSVTAGDDSVTIGGTDTDVTVAVDQANLVVAESQVTGLTTALAALAPIASPSFTGTASVVNETVTGAFSITVDTVTYASTITPDATTGNYFRCTLTGNVTLAAPTGGVDGQKVIIELVQDSTGSRLVTTSALHFGTSITSFTATTTASKRDKIGLIYNSASSVWDVVAVAQGF
jgi:hypothetical protein